MIVQDDAPLLRAPLGREIHHVTARDALAGIEDYKSATRIGVLQGTVMSLRMTLLRRVR
jgi:hypothetical protein